MVILLLACGSSSDRVPTAPVQSGTFQVRLAVPGTVEAVKETVLYGSIAQVTDFGYPSLLLVPGVGASIDPGEAGGPRFQLEVRYWAVNRFSNQNSVNWIPQNPGSVGIHLGFAWGFGRTPSTKTFGGSR